MSDFIDWTELEKRIPLDELPSFQRSFLQLARPDYSGLDEATLRKVQGNVQATLKQLERQGDVKQEGERLLIKASLVPESFQKYLSD